MSVKNNYAYVRVSTYRQEEEGYSIDAQSESIKQYCAKNGIVIEQLVKDSGYSGSNLNRPGIDSIINLIKQDKVNYLVIWNTSRLTRNMNDYTMLTKLLFQHQVTLCSVTEKIDNMTASGKLLSNITASFNEYEVNNMKERIKLGSNERAKSGYSNSGFVLGYDCSIDDNHKRCLVIDPDESKIVQLIFQYFISGSNMSSIAKQLNSMGYRTKRGNKFHNTSIENILSNKLYIGMSVYGKYRNYSELGRKGLDIENIIDVKGNHEKIIDMDTWNKAQKILHDSYCNNKIVRPLIGVLHCPKCGGEVRTSYTKNNKKLIRYYSCKKGVPGGCHANSINAEVVEYQAMLQITNLVRSSSIKDRLFSLAKKLNNKNQMWIKDVLLNQSSNISKYKDQLNSLEKASNNDEFLRTELSKEIETLKVNINECKNNVNKYQSKYSKLKATFANFETLNFDNIIESMYFNQDRSYFRKLSRLIFDSIKYDNKNKTITFNFNLSSLESKTISY